MRTLLWVLIAAVSAAAQESWFFVQLSDTQFGMYTKDADFRQETANYEFAVATLNRWKPRFAIVCGDLVNKPGDAAQIDEYLRISKKLDAGVKLYNVAGNHDVGNEPKSADLAAYRKRIGPDWYSFREASIYGIVLNSSLIHSPQNAPDEYAAQEKWVRDELVKARGSGAAHIVIFQHHPWFLKSATEPDEYFNIPLARRTPMLALFREFGVRYLFSGHYHRNALAKDGEMEMITTGPVGMPIGVAKSGLRPVQVTPGGLKHEYHELGNLPNLLK